MGAIREFRCKGHGVFESREAVCPHGCTAVEQIFLTAPAIGGSARNIDATFRTLANDFGLSDMNTNLSRSHNGGAARVLSDQQKKAIADQDKLRHRFAPLAAKGGTYHVGERRAIGGTANSGAIAAIAQHGAQPTDVMTQARENFIKPVHSVQDFQHRVEIKRDPDKDSVMKVKRA